MTRTISGIPTFHPEQKLVSIITPTRHRSPLLRRLYTHVKGQVWPYWEWLILDDGDQPDKFFVTLADSRIRYKHIPARMCLGEKRNYLVSRSSGTFIAHFDDDDYYGPEYLRDAIFSLLRSGSSITKYVGYLIYDSRHNRFFYWDQTENSSHQYVCKPGYHLHSRRVTREVDAMKRDHLTGYGFSYVYMRALWQEIKFPHLDVSEDLGFMQRAITNGYTPLFAKDVQGNCVHIVHGANSSGCFPQFELTLDTVKERFPRLRAYLHDL